jgi:subtilisin family serine protease
VGGVGVSEYAMPGFGGRAPVNWIGPPPYRCADDKKKCRRPVVAILDTGVGYHKWWDGENAVKKIVTRGMDVNGFPIGLKHVEPDVDDTGIIGDPITGMLASDAGHGTFIAGLIHQVCPDADILSIRTMPDDGVVPEDTLLEVLTALVGRQKAALANGDSNQLIDVISLSLGYYHEMPDDPSFDPKLFRPLQELAAMGVAVVASAGNESTFRPMYPAAFTPHDGGLIDKPDPNCVPLISVGALNPDGTVAMFSNAGKWITCYRAGAGVVSTFPQNFDGARESSQRLQIDDRVRATIDPDDFSCGFGTWSGTSFAAPILAGELAQALIDECHGDMESTDQETCVRRGWTAVQKHTELTCS